MTEKLTIPDKPEVTREKFPFLHLLLSTIISIAALIALLFLGTKSYDFIISHDSAVNANGLRILLILTPFVLVAGMLLWLARRSYKNGKRRYMQSYLLTLVTGTVLMILLALIIIFLLSGIEC
jgi:hypothetical protein